MAGKAGAVTTVKHWFPIPEGYLLLSTEEVLVVRDSPTLREKNYCVIRYVIGGQSSEAIVTAPLAWVMRVLGFDTPLPTEIKEAQ